MPHPSAQSQQELAPAPWSGPSQHQPASAPLAEVPCALRSAAGHPTSCRGISPGTSSRAPYSSSSRDPSSRGSREPSSSSDSSSSNRSSSSSSSRRCCVPLRRHGDELQRLPGGYYTAQGRVDDTMNLGGCRWMLMSSTMHCDGRPADHASPVCMSGRRQMWYVPVTRMEFSRDLNGWLLKYGIVSRTHAFVRAIDFRTRG